MGVPDSTGPVSKEEMWRALMLGTRSPYGRKRRIHSLIPSPPRCKSCAAPFGGIGGLYMSRRGHARWPKNPKYCEGCFRMLQENHGGAEIDCSLLFADVRGSTTLAEQMPPTEFMRLMGRFYDTATEVLVNHGAIVDKFVGDQVMAIFIPAMAGQQHARRAVHAARQLLRRTGHSRREGPWLPIGVGVNTGLAYVGSIGEGLDTDMTAMGDVVNVTARLSSLAGQGEILVTAPAAASARPAERDPERRSLLLKGKSEPIDVVVLGVRTRT